MGHSRTTVLEVQGSEFIGRQAQTLEIIHDHIFCKLFIDVLDVTFTAVKASAMKFAVYSTIPGIYEQAVLKQVLSLLKQSQSCTSGSQF